MDNAPYHNVETELCPTQKWKKEDIDKWLEEKGEVCEKPMLKIRFLEIVKRIKPKFNKYVIDNYVKEDNLVVLRLSLYHCELNPVELVVELMETIRYIKVGCIEVALYLYKFIFFKLSTSESYLF